ncbi:MAG: hypothetical protein K1X94_03835 [Sandaracinaceae bacterium]|nr:hypothetical protein [Sandaracinaceae bacterium]
MSRLVCSAAVLALALAGCGAASSSSSSSSTATTASSSSGGSRFAAPERPWGELDHAARAHHMSRQVVPAMSELFLAYAPDRYGDFGCPTCHGPDARERHYAMPSPSLPALYPTGSIGQHRAVAEHPEAVRFMFSEVTPAMQQLLGAAAYDEHTREGFTCFACHPHAADDDPLSQSP